MFSDDDKVAGDFDTDTLDAVAGDTLTSEDEDDILGSGLDGDEDDA